MGEWNFHAETNDKICKVLRERIGLVCQEAKQEALEEAIARILEYVAIETDRI